ncbi:alpha/beta fold hydrolase [Lactiplantibacillus sp. DA1]|uniref:alpha/beta hydrolase n=1 Tax=Lactiplantibacillus sp. DA1 TaxID=3079857 RepID=UPI00292A60A5|nr:alpha/beta fold hydrolase [Lactiplantibacillus sp. DA1]MDV0430362.1 alpha/beta fold hydrolase [Lactiplantibacillus sp. DA1]
MDFKIKRDGLALQARLETPITPSTTLVILMHGFTADMGYDTTQFVPQLAQALVTHGLAVLRFDFNGHSRSEGRFQDMTVVNEIADAKAVLDKALALHYSRIVLAGHSQGGVVASMLAGYYPDVIDQLVLMAPAATLKTDAQQGVLQGATYDPQHIPAYLNIRDDLKVGGFYLRTAQQLPIYEVAQQYAGPVTLIHGTADTVVSPRASEKYHEVYQHSQLHWVQDGDHRFSGDARSTAIRLALGVFK